MVLGENMVVVVVWLTYLDIVSFLKLVRICLQNLDLHISLCVSGEGWIYRDVSKQIVPEKEELSQEQEGPSRSGSTGNKQGSVPLRVAT